MAAVEVEKGFANRRGISSVDGKVDRSKQFAQELPSSPVKCELGSNRDVEPNGEEESQQPVGKMYVSEESFN
jgi:hypothetical protein